MQCDVITSTLAGDVKLHACDATALVRNVFTLNYAYVLQGESLDLKRRTLDKGDCRHRIPDTGDCKHRTLDPGDCKHELEPGENSKY